MNAAVPDYYIVIPARMAAQRLPGKPLAKLAGLSLLQHVYQRAMASSAKHVVIATDDEAIAQHARSFAAKVMMTSAAHQSGSDRIAEVVTALQWPDQTIVVNLQGDEPLMPAACLDQVACLLETDPSAAMASLYWPISSAAEVQDPNVVKVVLAQAGNALYFSRSVLPYPRDWSSLDVALSQGMRWNRHVGLYAYRVGALKRFSQLSPTALEQAEKLEQLRMLESGGRIAMAEACTYIPPGVDTPEDLQRVEGVMINKIN
ncbi:MAG: 3-deoxy-manno-octulosonate cytidylyltransferase [Xanthomonadales bacterium]|nr:3-deoxy-manno-octulosonate cytidylyltransferase [Xanthomonadales bacterium]